METVERCADDVRYDKQKMIKDVLMSIINRDDGMVSLRELRDAFSAPSILDPEDIDAIMHEV